jgi:lipoprotein-anchoring transpeptidase ErfK/SrfK
MKIFYTTILSLAVLLVSPTVGAQEAATVTTKPAYVHISKQDMMLYLCDSLGGHIAEYPMACGRNVGDKQMVGDMKTPEGVFEVQQIQDASSWTHDFKDGKGVIKNAYGPWFIRLLTPGHSGIGIHGTHAPESIGTRATEGCMRLHNQNVAKLKPNLKIGMPVIITSSEADMRVNISTGKDAQIPLYLKVSKQDMKLYVINYLGNAIAEFPIACGTFYGNKRSAADLRKTPEGFFKIASIEDSSSWPAPEGDERGSYGPKYVRIGTKGYNGIGIYGSDNKKLFEENGARTTDGNIVLSSKDFKALEGYLRVGMSIHIIPSETDLRVNRSK